MSAGSERIIRLGEIAGVFGVKGWVKLRSFTEPRTNLIEFASILLESSDGWEPVTIEAARVAGMNLIAKLAGTDDRDQAQALIGTGIGVRRADLPPCDPGEYYWADLEGLMVVSQSGRSLGRVSRLIATGANDVLVLDGSDEKLIPFVVGDIVTRVDFAAGQIEVDWDESFWE